MATRGADPTRRVRCLQTAFQQVEAIADRTAYFIVPFYDEIKLAVLLWMLASRTVVRVARQNDKAVT